MYIHERYDWPNFSWDSDSISVPLGEVRRLQGALLARMQRLGFPERQESQLKTMTLEILKSTEIEGEILDAEQVRSSLARRLGLAVSGLVSSDRNVDGVVDMLFDATQNYLQTLSAERFFNWQAALFPGGKSGMFKIVTGAWRDDFNGPMQVVSGGMGRERVHFQAPEASRIPLEMKRLMDWINSETHIDPVLKAAIAHLWFITIHPFDDGNGRIARALTDMMLARADGSALRFYSMSVQIRAERNRYYQVLESTQKGDLEISEWLLWFLNCLRGALLSTEIILNRILQKASFWDAHRSVPLNERQHLMLNKVLDGFDGHLTAAKWAKITKSSPDTALRDIQDLIRKGMLQKMEAGGRSTAYEVVLPL